MTPPDKKVRISVKVTPNAPKNELSRFDGQLLDIKISAPPVKGRANRELIAYLCKMLGLKKDDIVILSGHTSRNKTLSIHSISQKELIERLYGLIDRA